MNNNLVSAFILIAIIKNASALWPSRFKAGDIVVWIAKAETRTAHKNNSPFKQGWREPKRTFRPGEEFMIYEIKSVTMRIVIETPDNEGIVRSYHFDQLNWTQNRYFDLVAAANRSMASAKCPFAIGFGLIFVFFVFI